MKSDFTYFVLLADMRTGSNFLEASLNEFDDIECYGEVFNPVFIGQHNRTELFGFDVSKREKNPVELVKRMRSQTDGIAGFRFFHDHDPRVLEHVLSDHECAKVILTRNPLESYVSLKIAAQTNQWKLSDVAKRKSAKAVFDAAEFKAHFEARHRFQARLLKKMQTTGQSAFYLSYEDIQNVDVINGLAQFLGSGQAIKATAKQMKKQNPGGLEALVENYDDMITALAGFDHFKAADIPNFEPRRGPKVPDLITTKDAPLLFVPVPGGPVAAVCDWLAALDDVKKSDLRTGWTQQALRHWKRDNPGHQSFAMIRHPLARAHHVFCDCILKIGDDSFEEPRRVLEKSFGLNLPKPAEFSSYTVTNHKDAFSGFLRFLKMNLSGQTSVRIDSHWASQTAVLSGVSQVLLPDVIVREASAELHLRRLAEDLGLEAKRFQNAAEDDPFTLSSIYDKDIEKLCRAAYRKDYFDFGFDDWTPLA